MKTSVNNKAKKLKIIQFKIRYYKILENEFPEINAYVKELG